MASSSSIVRPMSPPQRSRARLPCRIASESCWRLRGSHRGGGRSRSLLRVPLGERLGHPTDLRRERLAALVRERHAHVVRVLAVGVVAHLDIVHPASHTTWRPSTCQLSLRASTPSLDAFDMNVQVLERVAVEVDGGRVALAHVQRHVLGAEALDHRALCSVRPSARELQRQHSVSANPQSSITDKRNRTYAQPS